MKRSGDFPGARFFVLSDSDQAHARGHLLVVVALDQRVDPVVGVQELAEAAVVVQGGDDEGDIFAHIRFNEPLLRTFSLQQPSSGP